MYTHASDEYICPLCLAIKGIENSDTMMMQNDIFYRDELVSAAVNSKFISSNPGHVIVMPNRHYENFYDMPAEECNQIMRVAKLVSLALKEVRKCDGITIKQNNEPAGGQHALHYHMHIVPRFEDDHFLDKLKDTYISSPVEREKYTNELKKYFKRTGIS